MENTGDKGYRRLEQYDPNTGLANGEVKLNHSSDPDYVLPVHDETYCPLNTPPPAEPNSLSATPGTYNADFLPNNFNIDVVANGNWAANKNKTWITLSVSSGGSTSGTTIDVYLQKNDTTYMRSGQIKFYMDGVLMDTTNVYQQG